MYKYFFAGIVVVVLMILVTGEKLGACNGKAIGEECVIGAYRVGLCVEEPGCEGESGCGLVCKVKGHHLSKRDCCNPVKPCCVE